MYIENKSIEAWLKHRLGSGETNYDKLPRYFTKALEQNRLGPSFVDTYGKNEIQGYVGFIDLMGFSDFCYGKSAIEIKNFILPFLENVCSILSKNHCLIDKTIGDEIMFVLPSMEEREGLPAIIVLGQLFGELLKYSKDNNYKFRIAFSYGNIFLDVLKLSDYVEWMIFGEPIVVAKRLMSLPEIQHPNPIIAAVGGKNEVIPNNMPDLSTLSEVCAGFSSNWKVSKKSEADLKGVGKISFHLWIPIE